MLKRRPSRTKKSTVKKTPKVPVAEATARAEIKSSPRPSKEKFVQALRSLNQPWNPVVRAAIKLLEQPDALERWKPDILEYAYSECPLIDGHWRQPGSTNSEHGPVPLGIVLKNVFEVAIRDKWKDGSQEKQRLVPVAMLDPGALFGAFEFCDVLASTPSLHNYEVSAGSRAFKIVRRQTDGIRWCNGAFFKSLKNLNACSDWRVGCADHDAMIRYYDLHCCEACRSPGSEDVHNHWTAEILLLTQTPVPILAYERDFLDVVQNAAWQQSQHLREGHLKWLRHDLSAAEFDAKTVTLAAVSKFKRKLELATSEECILFGELAADERLRCYGPLTELLEKINDTLFPTKKTPQLNSNSRGSKKDNERITSGDILVPVFLHDTGGPCYLSLWDDTSVFHKDADINPKSEMYRGMGATIGKIVERVDRPDYPAITITAKTQSGGRADPFWRGAVELKSRFPQLPCLEAAKPEQGTNSFARSAIVMAQHLLEETGSLIQKLVDIGGQSLAEHVFVIGKPYSSNPRVWKRISNLGVHVEELLDYDMWKRGEFEAAWRKACKALWDVVQQHLERNPDVKRVLILDDGGMLHDTVPQTVVNDYAVAGVEQTSKGLKVAKSRAFPIVGVACSAAKKRLEPTIVAETVWSKLENVLPQARAGETMAVCGLGNVGGGLARFISAKLSSGDQTLLVWDNNLATLRNFRISNGTVTKAESQGEIFEKADVIFGCSGIDLTQGNLKQIEDARDGQKRYLISCSSNDIEFASLLKQPEPEMKLLPGIMPFDLARYEKHRGTVWLIPQAGFPITFDRAPCAAPIEQVQMTRGLLLAGLFQAAELAANNSGAKGIVPLDPKRQIDVVNAWRESNATGRDSDFFADHDFHKEISEQAVEEGSKPPPELQ
jgi:S-adenosylhomocysteine hydrolase